MSYENRALALLTRECQISIIIYRKGHPFREYKSNIKEVTYE